jgi:hypothetical protein
MTVLKFHKNTINRYSNKPRIKPKIFHECKILVRKAQISVESYLVYQSVSQKSILCDVYFITPNNFNYRELLETPAIDQLLICINYQINIIKLSVMKYTSHKIDFCDTDW